MKVLYIGPYDRRELTAKDFEALGVPHSKKALWEGNTPVDIDEGDKLVKLLPLEFALDTSAAKEGENITGGSDAQQSGDGDASNGGDADSSPGEGESTPKGRKQR